MGKLTERQTAVIKFLRNQPEETAKRSEIVYQFSHWYYCNGEKHVSDILHRMVQSGLLIKPKHGFYKIGTGKKSKPVPPEIDNQINLF